ncbi:MAG: hypothetical protein QM820_65685 [Minicystis sp.]
MKRFFLLLALALPMSLVPLQGGCNGQAEGQLCSPLNVDTDGVNLDCQTGLACVSLSGGTSGTSGVCCAQPSSHPACVNNSTTTTNTGTTTTTSSTTSNEGGGGGGTGGSGAGGSSPDGGMSDGG